VRDKRRAIAMAFYEMGQALVTLADASIYGALGYATFDALLHEEPRIDARSNAQVDRCAERRRPRQRAKRRSHAKASCSARARRARR